jgi:serpin B
VPIRALRLKQPKIIKDSQACPSLPKATQTYPRPPRGGRHRLIDLRCGNVGFWSLFAAVATEQNLLNSVQSHMRTKLFALILGAGLSWCLSAHAGTLPSGNMQNVVAGNTEFAVDLYGKLRTQDGNLFFSPYSISTALAMTYGGARGETAKQMAQTLHFDLPERELAPAFGDMENSLNAVQAQGHVRLAVANSLWPQKGYTFRADYLDLCEKYYGTSIRPVDYIGDTEGARQTINGWVEAKTNDKIVDLLKPGMLDAATRLVLVNAIYFKGNWVHKFDPARTQDEPFHVSSETIVTAPLMRQTSNFGYAEFPDLQVLELPYEGNEVSMVVLLPRAMAGLGKLEEQLTAEKLAMWTAQMENQKVAVYLPTFKATSEFSLAGTLSAMGMPDAFIYGKADFSGMDGTQDLYISKVIHKAYVDVDEEGTEAAAATAVTVDFGMAMPRPEAPIPVFRADHPFLFLIRDNQTGSVLFLGRVMDPKQ